MKNFNTSKDLQDFVNTLKSENKSIGFVPTMGALHQGHLSLIKQAKLENDVVVVSIFVNPTQFNNSEDLKKYPRTEEKDIQLLESVACDVVFLPQVEDMYPDGEKLNAYDFQGLDTVMEGAFRPGHFQGAATIVQKLFELVQPDKAYFGEKDFQQVLIIKSMVKQKKLPVEIVPMPIFRENSGLAMSSRNTRLTPDFMTASPFIYQILLKVKDWRNEFSVHEIKEKVENLFADSSLKLEYFSITEEENLVEIGDFEPGKSYRAFLAVYAGEIRLIDNLQI